MKTISKLLAIGIFAVAASCTNRTANSEDNNNESHLGTDIDRQSHSDNDSLPTNEVDKTATDTAVSDAKYNATEASRANGMTTGSEQGQPAK